MDEITIKLKTKWVILSIVGALIVASSALLFWSNYKRIKQEVYDHFVFSYDSLNISSELKENLNKYGLHIREPYDTIYARNDLIRFGTANLKEHRYSKYYFDLAEYLNDEKTIRMGKKLRDQYWKTYDPFDKDQAIKKFEMIVGYHEKIVPKGEILKKEVAVKKKSGGLVEKLLFRGRFGIPFIVLHGIPEHKPKGILIAIHGRSTGPDHVMGIYEEADYTRRFGAYWQSMGFEVYAPQVDWDSCFPLERLNYTAQGMDLAKIGDIIDYILNSRNGSADKRVPIIVAGISYGSMLAEFSGIIFKEIDAVISIGGNARGDYFDRLIKGQYRKDPTKPFHSSYLPPAYYFYYSGIGLYKLIAPKPLVISIGTHDHGEVKFKMIFETVDYYNSIGMGHRIELNVFKGRHEADPEGEVSSFEKIMQSEGFGLSAK